jgi:conjugative transfer signal peptidase TraF
MTRKRAAVLYMTIALCALFLAIKAYGMGYRVNISPSVPVGLWKVSAHTEQMEQMEKLEKGVYVIVPTVSADDEIKNPGYKLAAERGYLASPMPMLKRVAAVEGDFVSYDVDEEAVTVNGGYVFMTAIMSQDTEGRPMPSASFPLRLGKYQVWLSSENIRGYDSRYFGPVSSDILQKAVPVWIFR